MSLSTYPIVPQENWETYFYNAPKGPVFVTFWQDAKKIGEEYIFCARVVITIKKPNENGGPNQSEADKLYKIEDELTHFFKEHKTNCILLARLTHDGNRELVFQLQQWDTFRPPVGLWMLKNKDWEIDVFEHQGWDFFNDSIWPSEIDWKFIHDRRVIDSLVEHGSDPQKEHSLEYLFEGKEEKLQQLKGHLNERDYQDGPKEEDPQRLLMIKKLPLDINLVFAETMQNEKICQEWDIAFNGWGASIQK